MPHGVCLGQAACVDASVCVWAGEVESGSIFILYESVCVFSESVCVSVEGQSVL